MNPAPLNRSFWGCSQRGLYRARIDHFSGFLTVFYEKPAGFLLKSCIFPSEENSRKWQNWEGGKEGPACWSMYGRVVSSSGIPKPLFRSAWEGCSQQGTYRARIDHFSGFLTVLWKKSAGFLVKSCIFTPVEGSRKWQNRGGGKGGPMCWGTFGREGSIPRSPSPSVPVNGNAEERRRVEDLKVSRRTSFFSCFGSDNPQDREKKWEKITEEPG